MYKFMAETRPDLAGGTFDVLGDAGIGTIPLNRCYTPRDRVPVPHTRISSSRLVTLFLPPRHVLRIRLEEEPEAEGAEGG